MKFSTRPSIFFLTHSLLSFYKATSFYFPATLFKMFFRAFLGLFIFLFLFSASANKELIFEGLYKNKKNSSFIFTSHQKSNTFLYFYTFDSAQSTCKTGKSLLNMSPVSYLVEKKNKIFKKILFFSEHWILQVQNKQTRFPSSKNLILESSIPYLIFNQKIKTGKSFAYSFFNEKKQVIETHRVSITKKSVYKGTPSYFVKRKKGKELFTISKKGELLSFQYRGKEWGLEKEFKLKNFWKKKITHCIKKEIQIKNSIKTI